MIATGPVRLIISNQPSVDHIDQLSSYDSLQAFCGFPPNSIQVHDVGLQQTWLDGLTQKFVGTETISNLDTGKFAVLKQSLRVTTELSDGSHAFPVLCRLLG